MMRKLVLWTATVLLCAGCNGGQPSGNNSSTEDSDTAEDVDAVGDNDSQQFRGRIIEIIGEEDSDRLGRFAATGDLDGDGLMDIAFGAYRCGPHGCGTITGTGRVYIYLGATLSRFEGSVLNTSDYVVSEGTEQNQFGRCLDIGDVNGDGYDDLLVGAPDDAGNRGSVFVYFGQASGFLTEPSLIYRGETDEDHLGVAVSVLGDLDGDGREDFALGAPYYSSSDSNGVGRVDVFRGASTVETPVVSYVGTTAGIHFGSAIGPAGDMDGDGTTDIIIGSKIEINENQSPPTTDPGEVHVYSGTLISSTPIVKFVGDHNLDDFGISIAGVGDINGDDRDDLLIGAGEYFRSLIDEDRHGSAYIYHGGTDLTGVLATSDADVHLTGPSLNSGFGFYVSALGDINGDGSPDFSVSAPANHTAAGCAFIYLGNRSPIEPAASFYFGYQQSNFGENVMTVLLGETPWVAITAYKASTLYPDGDIDQITEEQGTSVPAPSGALDNAGAGFLIPISSYL